MPRFADARPAMEGRAGRSEADVVAPWMASTNPEDSLTV